MITADQLRGMLWSKSYLNPAKMKEKLAVGVQQETKEEWWAIRCLMRHAMMEGLKLFKVVLDAACKEAIQPLKPWWPSFLAVSLETRPAVVVAVVERMRMDDLRETSVEALEQLSFRYRDDLEQEVVQAVLSLMTPSVFCCTKALYYAIRCKSKARACAVEAVLKYGPSMEQRLEAGMQRFGPIRVAASCADLETLQQMHDLLPLMPDGSGRRLELADYAQAIETAAENEECSTDVQSMIEYLAEEAGDEEVFDLCPHTILLNCTSMSAIEWLVDRAPQLLEAACKDPKCMWWMTDDPHRLEVLASRMVELVDREVLGRMMRELVVTSRKYVGVGSNWRSALEPVFEAVPECLNGLRRRALVDAIRKRAYIGVEYMLGNVCTREHLLMRNKRGNTAYDIAAFIYDFPPKLLKRLEVVRMTKGAHA